MTINTTNHRNGMLAAIVVQCLAADVRINGATVRAMAKQIGRAACIAVTSIAAGLAIAALFAAVLSIDLAVQLIPLAR